MSDILERVHKSALEFLTPLTLDKTFETISKEAMSLIGAEYSSIFLESSGELERVYSNSVSIADIPIKKKGYVYECFKSGNSHVVNQEEVRKLKSAVSNLGIKSIILFPLTYQNKTIGVLSVLSKEEKSFKKQHLEALNIYGSFASLAIKKTQLSEETQRLVHQRDIYRSQEVILEKIHNAALKFLKSNNSNNINKIIVDEGIKLVDAKYGSLLLDKDGSLERVYSTLPIASQIEISKRGFTYRTFKYGKPLIKLSKNFSNTKKVYELGLQSNIFIPLTHEDDSLGVLIINSKENVEFTNRELNILKLYGSLASLAIKKTNLYTDAIKALSFRDIFVSMAAHELRTPLTTIHGYVQMLNRKSSFVDSPERRWVEELQLETFRLMQLINEILSVNRIQSGTYNFDLRECSLRELVENAIYKFKLVRPHCKIVTQDNIKSQDLIVGDPEKISQVLLNLLDNSAKFSLPEQEILVELKNRSPYFLISVKDSGKGISEKDLPRVFDGYYIGKNHTVEGMGLGLFIAKNVIEQHHGYIDVKSKLNKGTKVEIKLPKAKI